MSECHNHPHNFYTQILGETGLIGLTLAVIFFAILVFHCYDDRKQSEFHVLSRTAFVIPRAIFWPTHFLMPNFLDNGTTALHTGGMLLGVAYVVQGLKKKLKNEKNFCFLSGYYHLVVAQFLF